MEGEEQLTPEQQEEAFAAGFAEASGTEVPPTPEAPEPAATPAPEKPAAEEATPAESKPEITPTLIAGLTEDEVKALFGKVGQVDTLNERVQQIFGRLGSLNQTLTALQQARTSGGIKLSPEQLKRTASEFPEMAKFLAEDLSEALASLPPGGQAQPAFDPSQVDQLVSTKLAETESRINQALEKRWLKRLHPDWESVVASQDFGLWQNNVLGKDDAAKLADSWDADFIAGKLTEFKAWQAKAAQAKVDKQKRLEAAVAPTEGNATPEPTSINDEDAFLYGFNQARGGLA